MPLAGGVGGNRGGSGELLLGVGGREGWFFMGDERLWVEWEEPGRCRSKELWYGLGQWLECCGSCDVLEGSLCE